ncbi:MAG: hypothetical protein V3S74_09095 [Alphaproteobacteria bacterium]
MGGTDPHLLVFSIVGLGTLMSLLASLGTWHTSRAKKVRLLEDQVVSAVRAQRERADQIEVKLAEWQVTMTSMLAEAEEFFERSVKERKRANVAAARQQAEQQGQPFDGMARIDQIASLREHFANR